MKSVFGDGYMIFFFLIFFTNAYAVGAQWNCLDQQHVLLQRSVDKSTLVVI